MRSCNLNFDSFFWASLLYSHLSFCEHFIYICFLRLQRQWLYIIYCNRIQPILRFISLCDFQIEAGKTLKPGDEGPSLYTESDLDRKRREADELLKDIDLGGIKSTVTCEFEDYHFYL